MSLMRVLYQEQQLPYVYLDAISFTNASAYLAVCAMRFRVVKAFVSQWGLSTALISDDRLFTWVSASVRVFNGGTLSTIYAIISSDHDNR